MKSHLDSLREILFLTDLANNNIDKEKLKQKIGYTSDKGHNLIISKELIPGNISIRAEHPGISPEAIEESILRLGYEINSKNEDRAIYTAKSENFLFPNYLIVTNGNNKGIVYSESIELDEQSHKKNAIFLLDNIIRQCIIDYKK